MFTLPQKIRNKSAYMYYLLNEYVSIIYHLIFDYFIHKVLTEKTNSNFIRIVILIPKYIDGIEFLFTYVCKMSYQRHGLITPDEPHIKNK